MSKPVQLQDWLDSMSVPYGPYRALIELGKASRDFLVELLPEGTRIATERDTPSDGTSLIQSWKTART